MTLRVRILPELKPLPIAEVPIAGFSRYKISEFGVITLLARDGAKHLKDGTVIPMSIKEKEIAVSADPRTGGRLSARLVDDNGKLRIRGIGELMLASFENEHRLKRSSRVLHIDGDLENMALSNLRWNDRMYNVD